jgi:hypothetical protein
VALGDVAGRPSRVTPARRKPRGVGSRRASRAGPLIRIQGVPAKKRHGEKIDAAVALMVVVGRAMAEDASKGDLEDFLRDPAIA